jgi:hypothetical protein
MESPHSVRACPPLRQQSRTPYAVATRSSANSGVAAWPPSTSPATSSARSVALEVLHGGSRLGYTSGRTGALP